MCENGNECFLTIQLSENTRALFCLIDNVHNNTYYKPFITMFNLDISSIFFCNPVYILQTITMLFPLQTDNITIFFFYFPIKCVGLSLVVAMVVSSLVGTIIPMFFHKIHIDPAVASGPLITTVNDLVAVVTYYGLAMIFLVEIFHV